MKAEVYKLNEETAKFYHENLYKPTSKPAQEYIKKRKLNNNTLKTFMIGYSGNFNELYNHLKKQGFSEKAILESGLVNKNDNGTFIDRYRKRLMIPIMNERGKIIAFGGRVLDDSKPKYINSPENIVYSKGRNLFGLNVAKKGDTKKIVIVEGYMDAISLYQRGITNVVASLGTALTEAQGRLLRKNSEQIIIGYDSDGAGQAATVRGLEILSNLGCDVRVLQMEGAKDPDEFVIKYGSGRFNLLVDQAISLVEFKVKILKKDLNLENTSDKIKFLNEIAKVISKVSNNMEKEIYIDKIAKEYGISKEAIYAEVNKLEYKGKQGEKVLNKPKAAITIKKKTEEISEEILIRENTLIALLINYTEIVYNKIKGKIQVYDFVYEVNKKIVEKLYAEFEKESPNVGAVIDSFEDEEIINHLSKIMVEDYGITDVEKGVDDLLNSYEKEKLDLEKTEILKILKTQTLSQGEAKSLENRLNDIIIKLVKMK